MNETYLFYIGGLSHDFFSPNKHYYTYYFQSSILIQIEFFIPKKLFLEVVAKSFFVLETLVWITWRECFNISISLPGSRGSNYLPLSYLFYLFLHLSFLSLSSFFFFLSPSGPSEFSLNILLSITCNKVKSWKLFLYLIS